MGLVCSLTGEGDKLERWCFLFLLLLFSSSESLSAFLSFFPILLFLFLLKVSSSSSSSSSWLEFSKGEFELLSPRLPFFGFDEDFLSLERDHCNMSGSGRGRRSGREGEAEVKEKQRGRRLCISDKER